jgi:hypothetical protein
MAVDYDALIAQRLVYHKIPISRLGGLPEQAVACAEDHLFTDKLNIFVLDKEELACAQALCDEHVRNRGIHYAQILSNVHHHFNKTCGRFVDGRPTGRHAILPALYVDHPSVVWARNDRDNYLWLLAVLTVTWSEYKYRFGRKHRYADMLRPLSDLPNGIPQPVKTTTIVPTSPPAQCLREEFRIATTVADFREWKNTVDAYREYYIQEYADATWTRRMPPAWFVEGVGKQSAEIEASFEAVIELRQGGKKFKTL